jgi:hypothetical protein
MTFFRSPEILASILGGKKDFKVPADLPLQTTWLADGKNPAPLVRKQNMKLQIGGGGNMEQQGESKWIIKEEIVQLALATRKSTTIDDGYGRLLWNNSADSLATWDKNEIGAMLTLTAITEPTGTEYTGLTALAFPSGSVDGVSLGTKGEQLLPKTSTVHLTSIRFCRL